jgi:hypothetical protein
MKNSLLIHCIEKRGDIKKNVIKWREKKKKKKKTTFSMYFHLCEIGILPNFKELSTFLAIESLCLNCTLFKMAFSVFPLKFMQ